MQGAVHTPSSVWLLSLLLASLSVRVAPCSQYRAGRGCAYCSSSKWYAGNVVSRVSSTGPPTVK